MAAWLLWMVQHPSPLWRSYLALLPAEADMTCLLNFSNAEIDELQVPSLQVSSHLLRPTNHGTQAHSKFLYTLLQENGSDVLTTCSQGMRGHRLRRFLNVHACCCGVQASVLRPCSCVVLMSSQLHCRCHSCRLKPLFRRIGVPTSMASTSAQSAAP